ncbi:MAG: hypothetical protein CL398_10990, partial [Acidiferrobacteraceae bacterium]|nr:hypothetical protein [Acidiferrobacteraceae bacterium]
IFLTGSQAAPLWSGLVSVRLRTLTRPLVLPEHRGGSTPELGELVTRVRVLYPTSPRLSTPIVGQPPDKSVHQVSTNDSAKHGEHQIGKPHVVHQTTPLPFSH